MNDDLIIYMKGKAEKLSQNDPNKKKMADLRDKLLQKGIPFVIQPWKTKNAVDPELRTMMRMRRLRFPKKTSLSGNTGS
jgi:hypothetical protein